MERRLEAIRERDAGELLALELRNLSSTNQRAILSLVRRLRDRLAQPRNGEVEITLFVKSGSISQNYSFRDTERVGF